MVFNSFLAVSTLLAAGAYAQQVGTSTAETHPKLSIKKCTKSGCTTSQNSIVLDSNWRWVHNVGGYTNCYTGQSWDATLCPDDVTCAKNCALEGGDYSGTYGISTSGDSLKLKFLTGSNVGSRVYLMDTDDKNYLMMKMQNAEFSFDVDMSKLPCGLNGAVYFVQMDKDGGLAAYPGNKAGAKYGTGYCDAQCPRDMKFIAGEANVEGWGGASNDANSGKGKYGTCCQEMDIWEANKYAAAFTPHPCNVDKLYRCTDGVDCNSICDQPGCDFNSWRMGNKTFLGPGATGVDTNSKFTIVTQFINDASGTLTEIRRKYVQNGKVIENSQSTISGVTGNSITDKYCAAQKTAFNDQNVFAQMGGLAKMGKALSAGMVLTLSIWDDHFANMLWLDSDYPLDADNTKPGVNRGPCDRASGAPADVEANGGSIEVTYSNLRWGDLDSTYTASAGGSTNNGGSTTTSGQTSTTSGQSTTTSQSVATQSKYGQCGGIGYSGPTVCASGSTCKKSNDYYSQCL